MEKAFEGKYRDILIQYLEHQDEEILYTCEKLSREAMEERVSPEEIVHLHRSVLELYGKELPDFVRLSFDVLLEIMVGYGLAYMEHLSLRTEQKELRSEIAQAEDMQKTLMKTEVPEHDELDFGVISVAARQMSGDYYSFTEEGDKQIGIALADVIGKGIPAAFSISMIKYALAGMTGDDRKPSIVLESLNQVAEENINDKCLSRCFTGSITKIHICLNMVQQDMSWAYITSIKKTAFLIYTPKAYHWVWIKMLSTVNLIRKLKWGMLYLLCQMV